MTGAKVCLATAAGLEAATIDGLAAYEKLGIVALLLIAVVVIYRDGCKRQDKLEKIIKENTEAMTNCHETQRRNLER